MTEYRNPVCRGCWTLGNNCGTCERCLETRPSKSLTKPAANNTEEVNEPQSAEGWLQWALFKAGNPYDLNKRFTEAIRLAQEQAYRKAIQRCVWVAEANRENRDLMIEKIRALLEKR